tara:strand:- start:80 stop:1027 length:948 start_codon:yes stop_codon:yes gene_type:complete
MKIHKKCIKVTSKSFSNHPILKKELLDIFPNSIFNQDKLIEGSINIVDFLKDADGIILGLEDIDKKVLRKLKNLKIIAKYGVGLDNLDVNAAKDLGIRIGWTPGTNKRSVSEQTLGFLLGLSRNIFFSSFLLKKGVWEKKGGDLLTKKTVGIIGCGNIGTDLIKILKPFNCKVLINDILDKSELVRKYGVFQVSLDKLIVESDFLTIHVPLTDLTKNMVNRVFLKKMKSSAFLVNISRGPVVNQNDLKNALEKKIIAGAALDVFESEPPNDLEFISLPNLMLTPHIGGNANEAIIAMGRSAINHLVKFFEDDWKK